MKKTISQTLTISLLMASLAVMTPSHAEATILVYETGSLNADIDDGLNTLDTLTLNTSVNTAVFLLYSADAATLLTSATFAGEAMTIVNDGPRAQIAYLANPSSLSGDLVVDASHDNPFVLELAYWGVAEGIDTGNIQISLDTATGGGNQTITAFSSLNAGDVVYSVFADNNNANTAYSGPLIINDGNFGQHDAIITTDTVLTAGSFTPTTSYTTDGDPIPFGASIAFTAVPEPVSVALLLLGAATIALRRRAK